MSAKRRTIVRVNDVCVGAMTASASYRLSTARGRTQFDPVDDACPPCSRHHLGRDGDAEKRGKNYKNSSVMIVYRNCAQ